MCAADLHRRSFLRRIAAAASKVALVGVAAIALLLAGTWAFLQTRWGSQAVRHFALPRINAQLAGKLELGRFSFGGDHLTLAEVVLRDPSGAVVGRVARIDLSFSRSALLRRHLDLTGLVVARPELWLVQDKDGLNLTRALAARTPGPEQPPRRPASGPGLIVDLRKLTIRDGTIDLRSTAADPPRHLHVAALAVDGSAHYDAGRPRVSLDLVVDARGGHVDARGDFDLRELRALAPGLAVRVRDLDVSQLVEGAPASTLAFDLSALGGGRDLSSLDGSLDFALPAGRLAGRSFGPISLSARASGGLVTLADLRAVLPGVEIATKGTASAAAIDLRARIDAGDLGALAQSLVPWGIEPPALEGRGHLDLTLGGRPDAPSLRMNGDLPRLRIGTSSVESLNLTAFVPDLRSPQAADVDFAAPRALLGGQTLRGLTLSIHAGGTLLSASARTRAPFPMTLAVRGRRGSSPSALTIEALDLRYPEASWSLVRPARLEFGDGRFSVEGFALRAGRERIEGDLSQSQHGIRGRLVVAKFDLARLPRAFVPPALGVAGMVDVDARLAGSATDPRLDARVSLSGGRFRGYRDLSLTLDAHTAAARSRGRLELRGLGAAISTRFDLPAAWPIRDRQAPLLLDLTLAEIDLSSTIQALATATGRPIPAHLGGRAHLTARLDGTLQDPRLALSIAAQALVVEGQPVGDVELAIHGDGDHPLDAHLRVTTSGTGGAHTAIDLTTPLSLRAALRRPPTPDSLGRLPIEVRGEVDRLPLAVLAKLARARSPVGGTLSSHLTFSGTALEPRGTLTADVVGASAPGVPATDARLELELQRRAIDAHLRVLRGKHPLLALEAHLDASVPVLLSPARLADAPLRLRAVVGPLELQRLGLPPLSDRDPPRALKGRVHLDLAVDGTLRAPRVVWHTDADDIRLDKSLVGVAHLEGTYADRRATVNARLVTVNQGELRAVAVTSADLGYPQIITHGLDVRHLPLDVRLDAQRFDVQGLSGATPGLRTVGGLFSASANIRGTVADPRIGGRLEWTDGLLAITGLGEYHDIHLAVHGDDQKLILDELRARSGNGTARVTGDAAHASGAYHFSARADVSRFPIYQEGQPLAQVSLSTTLTGTTAPFDTRANVEIDNARIELSDAKRKTLQSLVSPADVVLVDAGQPLNGTQAERLRALLAARPRPKGGPALAGNAPAPPPVAAISAVRVTVNAPQKIWVTGKDAYFEIGLGPGFRVSMTDRTRVVGQVVVKRGRIDVFGRRFDLKADSTLEFSGSPDRPRLDLTAQYQNQLENITVVLTAKGPIDHLTIAITSPNRPELAESQLYTLVITGHLQLGGGTSGSSTPTAEAASLLGGALAARLQKTLAKKLPLDVLTVDAGSGEGLNGTQLEAGRYVAEKLYVGYVGRVGANPNLYQNGNAVHVEYQLSSRWGVDGEYGDVGTGSLDLTWKKNY